jgi:hypothetical protein
MAPELLKRVIRVKLAEFADPFPIFLLNDAKPGKWIAAKGHDAAKP